MALEYSVQITQNDNAQLQAIFRQAVLKKALATVGTADAAEKVAIGQIVVDPGTWGRRAFAAALTHAGATPNFTDAGIDTVVAAIWPSLVLAAAVV